MKKRKIKAAFTRPVKMFAFICFLFAAALGRIAFIGATGAKEASVETVKNISFGESRGYIYDRNMQPLVNGVKKNISVILSSRASLELLAEAENSEKMTAENGLLISAQTETPIKETAVSVNLSVIQRRGGENLCTHIIGYTDSDGRGVCGIEKSYDRILNDAGGKIGVSYFCDAFGKALMGEGLTVNNENYDSPAGVVLTIDAGIQRIAEKTMESSEIEKGACVITDASSGEILAMCSVPVYDVNDIAASLDDDASPFLNRALCAYPVGSVFKPFIAAAAIESGTAVNSDFECRGRYDVGGEIFHCFNSNIHGAELLNDAVCNSCNCYFIDVGLKTGADKICAMCEKFGFGKEIRLTSDIIGKAGKLPEAEELSAPAALANLCFGQGELLATPLQLVAAYSVFASGGIYNEPYILKYIVDGDKNEYAYYTPENSLRVLDEGVCAVINEALRLNMTDGTACGSAPANTSSAGKTATAQTGDYDGRKAERLCTWFCGFFPFEQPEYCVCIFNEDGTTASADCAPVFKEITEKITDLLK